MMGTINRLSETMEERFGGRVKVAPYNIFYDDISEVKDLVMQITWNAIMLPAVFIDGEPRFEGGIDEHEITLALEGKGLGEISQG